jgi:transcriptional regulator of acetoin/glycerol metabolism
MEVIRAFCSAIPAHKRQEALAALLALACCQQNDAKKVS